jgi:hypothetical protein
MMAVACGLDPGGLLADSDGGVAVAEASVADVVADRFVDPRDGTSGDDGPVHDGTTIETDAPTHDGAGGRDAPMQDGASASEAATDGGNDDPIDEVASDANGDVDSAPPPVDAAPAPLSYDGATIADPDFAGNNWLGFCIGVASCYQGATVSACIGNQPQPFDPKTPIPQSMLTCVQYAGSDCAAVFSCVQGGSTACNSTTRPDSCKGNVFNTCLAGAPLAIDCGPLGMVCSEGAGNPGCGFGDCYAWQEGQTVCAAQYVVECHNGRYQPHLDCQMLGLTCGGSPAQCQNLTPGCAGVNCTNIFGSSVTYQCMLDGNGVPECVLGTECTPSHTDTCDSSGMFVKYCDDGTTSYLYNCPSAHWAGCNNGLCVH